MARPADADCRAVPSAPMKRTAMPSASRATSSAISSRSSHTARRRSRCTGAAVQLAGNLPLALAEHMIDRGRDRGQPPRRLAFRRARGKSLRKFFGDETGRKLALAPARMMHQGREERNVVPDAVDIEGIERGRLRLDRGGPRRRMRDEFGDHRIVMDRDLAAFLHAGVVAHGDAVAAALPPAGGISPAVRSTAGNCGTDLRHRRGIPPPSRSA